MKRWLPDRKKLARSRWLRPVAHLLHEERFWRLDRESVSRAVGIGLFFGLLVPAAQFILAIMVAIALRGNIAIAAAFTLITNPLTFGPIYWLAYRIGSGLLEGSVDEKRALEIEAEVAAVGSQPGLLEATWQIVQSAGAPLFLGLFVVAVTTGVIGFVFTWFLWRQVREWFRGHADHP